MHSEPEKSSAKPVRELRMVVIYDNNPYAEGLETAWGFSCLIEGTEKTILFDTGGNDSILMENIQRLGINPREIDLVVISHVHADHVGGLGFLLEQNREVTVYFPLSFPEGFKEALFSHGAKAVEVKKPIEICRGVYSTGELESRINEQSLIIRTERGLVVITGCAHPGIVETVRMAKNLMKDDVLLVTGGFHLRGDDRIELKTTSRFRDLGVKYVGPCHCTGEIAKGLFKEEYGDHFITVGVGRKITLEDLE